LPPLAKIDSLQGDRQLDALYEDLVVKRLQLTEVDGLRVLAVGGALRSRPMICEAGPGGVGVQTSGRRWRSPHAPGAQQELPQAAWPHLDARPGARPRRSSAGPRRYATATGSRAAPTLPAARGQERRLPSDDHRARRPPGPAHPGRGPPRRGTLLPRPHHAHRLPLIGKAGRTSSRQKRAPGQGQKRVPEEGYLCGDQRWLRVTCQTYERPASPHLQ
jgi:hypothetical protein